MLHRETAATCTVEQIASILVDHRISTAHAVAQHWSIREAPLRSAALMIYAGSIFKQHCTQFSSSYADQIAPNRKLNALSIPVQQHAQSSDYK